MATFAAAGLLRHAIVLLDVERGGVVLRGKPHILLAGPRRPTDVLPDEAQQLLVDFDCLDLDEPVEKVVDDLVGLYVDLWKK